METQPLKTVFHVHTDHSSDCNNSVETLIQVARARKIGCLAITDHDTLSGAREMAAKAPADLKVIIGQEVTTTTGHIIGLYLHEPIEPDLSPRETALAIKEQGGLVVVPHPYNRMFGCGLCRHLDEVVDLIDVVEVSNAQNLRSTPNRRAEQFARHYDFPRIVGVDIHLGRNLDACCQWLEPFDTPSEFVAALRRASFVMGRHTLAYFAWTAWYVFLDRSGIGTPATFGRHASQDQPKLVCESFRRPTPEPTVGRPGGTFRQ